MLAAFTSTDPNYTGAPLHGTYTINKATPSFNYLSSQTIAAGTATTTVSGYISAGMAIPTGGFVIVTLNGVSLESTVNTKGAFAVSFPTRPLPAGQYTIGYALYGDTNSTTSRPPPR